MSIGAIGSGAISWSPPSVGVSADPQAQKAQAAEQANLLNALRGIGHSSTVAANVTDGKGIDISM
jgi:hypothetical protein